jgi:hypothetical protein
VSGTIAKVDFDSLNSTWAPLVLGLMTPNEARYAVSILEAVSDTVPVPRRPTAPAIWGCGYCGGSEPNVNERGVAIVRCTRCGGPPEGMTMKQNTQPIEVTLPSGVFVRIRPVSYFDAGIALATSGFLADRVLAEATDEDERSAIDAMRGGVHFFMATLASRLCLFDDERRTPRQVLDMDCRDTSKLSEFITPFIDSTRPIIK